MRGRRTWIGLLLIVVVLALTGCTQASVGDSPRVAAADLPAEARHTLALIDAGGPFPYDQDGVVFHNYEGLLPHEDDGWYHEFTVETPGSEDRGARRIIIGGPVAHPVEYYWTEDHYQSFERIER